MREIGAAVAIVRLEDQLPLVEDEQAIGVPILFILRGGREFFGKLQDCIRVAPVDTEFTDGEAIFFIFRGSTNVGLFQIGQLGLKLVEVVFRVERRHLGGETVALLGKGE